MTQHLTLKAPNELSSQNHSIFWLQISVTFNSFLNWACFVGAFALLVVSCQSHFNHFRARLVRDATQLNQILGCVHSWHLYIFIFYPMFFVLFMATAVLNWIKNKNFISEISVCVCVYERECVCVWCMRERVCVCVREREREGERVQ